MAAIERAIARRPGRFSSVLLHTGQHDAPAMSADFLRAVGLREPDLHLPHRSGTPAAQIGGMVLELEKELRRLHPDLVIVVGDVNSTVAGALAAATLGIRLAHVEAGLRSFDRSMPEEVNRVIVDSIADILFASEPSGVENLHKEGRPSETIHLVGNVMIDTLQEIMTLRSPALPLLPVVHDMPFGILTLHRPSNVDDPATLREILEAIGEVARSLPILFPVHPRTRQVLGRSSLSGEESLPSGLHLLDPLPYPAMIELTRRATLVLTDSGGIQEETTFLGVPCLTLREVTERPVTVTEGTNRVIGVRPADIVRESERILAGDVPAVRCPALWDGKAADRVLDILERGAGHG